MEFFKNVKWFFEELHEANNRRVDYPIKSKEHRKKSTFPIECK